LLKCLRSLVAVAVPQSNGRIHSPKDVWQSCQSLNERGESLRGMGNLL